MKKILFCLFILPVLAQAQQKFEEITLTDNVKKIKVNNQITLGYSTESGVKIIMKEGLPFKDLNKNGIVDAYEDSYVKLQELNSIYRRISTLPILAKHYLEQQLNK